VKRPVSTRSVHPRIWYAGTDRELHGRALCDVGGRSNLGVGHLTLPPGCHTGPSHWHSLEEEHLYVLSGTATLHLGSETFHLSAGDYVCFPAGQAVGHHLRNDSGDPFVYLMVGERLDRDTVHYPGWETPS
jgi:uncharacterized cupin superfamily protein